MGCTQAGVLKPADNVLSRYMFQSLSQGIIETRSRSRRDTTEELFSFRPQFLDRGIVRTVRRQTQQFGSSLLDRRCHARGQVGTQIVKHHDFARMQLWHQHRVHVRLERRRICGARERQWCPHPVQAQRGDDGYRPPRSGDRAVSSFASRRPSVGRSHCCVDPRLIHKNQPFRLDPPHLPSESPALLLDVRPVSLLVRRVFFL